MTKFTLQEKFKHLFSIPVIIAALGYFVDIYDLLLFGIVRVPSLKDLNVDPDIAGPTILSWQMIGLLLGGILWGVLGDKKGRLSVLFGSIIIYSLANILCGFLPLFPSENIVFYYSILRFIAGVGLAGELGAGITLVSESLPKELRAIGTSIVAGFGLLGAVVANLTVELSGNWTTAYFIGGAMGFALLVLRISVKESGLFQEVAANKNISKGNFMIFFTDYNRFVRYLKCILIGLPTWFCIGILATLANQFGDAVGFEVKPGKAIMWAYVGISVGDFLSGFISQWLASRKKAIVYMMYFTIVGVLIILSQYIQSSTGYYAMCVWLGLGTGYWAMFVTVGAEQFGTNIRSTAATTIPNMVRGIVPLMLFLFEKFKTFGVYQSAFILGILVFGLAIYATLTIRETHNIDLDFFEE